jgi:hypothetical protein
MWMTTFTRKFYFTDKLDTDTLMVDTFPWGWIDFDFSCNGVFVCEARDGLLLAFFIGDGDGFLQSRRGRGRTALNFWLDCRFKVELDSAGSA